jgi:hypothetical protein
MDYWNMLEETMSWKMRLGLALTIFVIGYLFNIGLNAGVNWMVKFSGGPIWPPAVEQQVKAE